MFKPTRRINYFNVKFGGFVFCIKSLRCLCHTAELQAVASGKQAVGAEHYLLSLTELPDGYAKALLNNAGIEQEDIKMAIETQYQDALSTIDGCYIQQYVKTTHRLTSLEHFFFPSNAAAKQVMQRLGDTVKTCSQFNSLQVLLALAEEEYGVVARALQKLKIDKMLVLNAINENSKKMNALHA